LYFSLKDPDSTLSCVCFRGAAAKVRFEPGDGMRVIADGNISVYEKAGRYQLMVRALRPDGIGDLAAALEKLKQKLEAEGLFAPERKRPLPRFPQGIGLITSPTGAAIRDSPGAIRWPGSPSFRRLCRARPEPPASFRPFSMPTVWATWTCSSWGAGAVRSKICGASTRRPSRALSSPAVCR
jgi:hypothetical protein